jgi:hypothetical protein
MNANEAADPFKDERARGLGVSGLGSNPASLVVLRRWPCISVASSPVVFIGRSSCSPPWLLSTPLLVLRRCIVSSSYTPALDSDPALVVVRWLSCDSGGALLATDRKHTSDSAVSRPEPTSRRVCRLLWSTRRSRRSHRVLDR